MKLRERLNAKRIREGYVREDAISAARLPARRRRMLLISMIVVLPLGVFAFGTGINVALASGSVNSYNAGDFQGSASWARASVSLNPFDKYTPHYNLGTAYAAGDLLPEAVPELQTALDNAPNPEAACLPRANLALTLERLGDRYAADENFTDAMDSYRQALALWQEQPDDVCYDDPEFREKAENSIPRLEEKLKQAQQDQQDQQEEQGEGGEGEQGDGQGGEGEQGGGGQQGDGQGGDGEQGDGQGGDGEQGDGQGGDGEQGDGQGGGGEQGDGQGGGGQTGEGDGQGGTGGTEQGGGGTGGGTEQGGGSEAGGESDGGGGEVSSDALGDKLDELRELGELSDRERQSAGHKQGLSNTPW